MSAFLSTPIVGVGHRAMVHLGHWAFVLGVGVRSSETWYEVCVLGALCAEH